VKKIKWIPFALILIVIWSILRVNDLVNFSGTAGVIITIVALLCFVVMIVEFFKSGAISIGSFSWDVITAYFATLIGGVSLGLIYARGGFDAFCIPDVFVFLLFSIDGTLSLINTLKVARRDMSIGAGG
jgi:hypothetical protein